MSVETKEKTTTATEIEVKEETKEQKKKRRRRFGDRADGRRVRTLIPLNKLMPYLMATRNDAQNMFSESFDVSKTDAFCRQKVKEGYKNFGFLHVLLAAYVRMLAQHPEVNRFISGQKIYARNTL